MKDFLFTLLAWLVTLPFILGAVGFALYNADSVAITYSPFRLPAPMPVYVPVLCAVAFGFLFGALMTWAGMAYLRRKVRDQAKHIRALERQVEDLRRPDMAQALYKTPPTALIERY